MHELSFRSKNAELHAGRLRLRVQVFSYENFYTLDPGRVSHRLEGGCEFFECSALLWAGGQESEPGSVRVDIREDNGLYRIGIQAAMERKIRCVKLVVEGLPAAEIVNLRSKELAVIPDEGRLLNYPEGWRELATPLVILRGEDGSICYLRSCDSQVREKRVVLKPCGEGLAAELIFEEDATIQGWEVSVPEWEIGLDADAEKVLASHKAHVESAYRMQKWEERPDVPAWARRISLVAAIHLQHYTGRIFNDYHQGADIVSWFAERYPADETLFFFPGWEGRYYWQYGDYRPDPRMGGQEGFAELLETVREHGGHAMPMFGINVVNKTTEGYEQWGAPSQRRSASGNVLEASVDWDSSRDYDLGWGSMLNPGAPGWQNCLVSQVRSLQREYGFEAVFLDISAAWWNDPSFHVYRGTCELIRRIREGLPQLLVAGEGWYDAMSACTPLVQSGHTEGELHWHDDPDEALFTPYARSFGHLCLGDPGRGSTGVHELGINETWQVPLRKGVLPTVTIVDGSLEAGREQVQAVLNQARAYSAKFL